ncbi:MAG: YCF48-related protein [Flavobacterium circumlabens]|uniref:T9SS type A sorting domain-containing protein n=1 Tax=Flavobacterium circumlabens TaxID=2133765 RepID=UPI0032637211
MIKPLHYCIIAFFSFFCFTSNIISQNNWKLLNPTPSYKTGKEIKFISESTGFILNDNEILETVDSGISWKKKQNINSGNDLKFYNNLGYIVGKDGYILKSLDSGTSWTQVNTGFVANFNTVTIVNETTIIISSSNSIIKSLDGGSTWISLNIPSVTVNKTFFTTSLIGHAACNNGTMLKTIDGGVNWYSTMTSNSTPSNFFTVYFINQNVGFATREHHDLYKTTDGGETWTEIPTISDAIYTFSFLNENVGYAAGDHGVIFKTTDGGLTWDWAGFQIGRIYNTSIYGIHFVDDNIGFATGARGRIIKTTDGGKTWTENSPTYNDINNLQFLTNETGFAQSGNSFFKTTDSGKSWNSVGSIDYDRYSYIATFKFLNENLGYAVSGGTYGGYVFKTLDGGVTWNALNDGFRIIDEGANSLSLFDENTVVISGGYNQPKVLKTTDGGKNWVQLSSSSFIKIQFLDENIGYAHNYYDKKIYKTIDGGTNWTVVFTAEEDIKSIDFLDKDNGYIAGSNGLILKTKNGGIDWKKLTIPYEYYTYIKFYSKNVGYLFDEDGKLYKTENGGNSWKNIYTLPSGFTSNSITIVGKDIYLSGEYGKILKSEVDFEPFNLQLNPAENILSRTAVLSGSVSVNKDYFDNARLEYFNSAVIHKQDISTNTINPGTSIDFSFPVSDLDPDSTYYYRIVATRDNVSYYSDLKIFNTKEDYLITINTINNVSSNKAEIIGSITSYKYDITDVEYQYSPEQNFSKYDILNNSVIVKGNTTENIAGTLSDLKPKTIYYVRLKAKYEGKEIYSQISSFVTLSEYEINLYYPSVVNNDVTLSAYVITNSKDISNIVFEYGVLNYENTIAANIDLVSAGSSGYVSALLANLDPDKIYSYRLKALTGGNIIYSREGVFNTSKKILLKAGNVIENNSSIKLTGYVNSIGGYVTNIEFEYGTTESLGSTLKTNPNYAYGNSTYTFSADLDNPLKGEKYYYRIKGIDANNNNILYSDIMSFTTQSLGVVTPTLNNNVFLYPNPTNGVINIDLPNNKNVISIIVVDELGKMFNYDNNVKSGNLQKIDLSGKSTGIYYIKIRTDDNLVINKKVILK